MTMPEVASLKAAWVAIKLYSRPEKGRRAGRLPLRIYATDLHLRDEGNQVYLIHDGWCGISQLPAPMSHQQCWGVQRVDRD